MPFNDTFPNTITAQVTLYSKRNKDNKVINTPVDTYTLTGCVVDPLGWTAAKGLWDDYEEGVIALHFGCVNHYPVVGDSGTQLSHLDGLHYWEVVIPRGSAMAGVWESDALPSCSNDPDLGDTLRLKRK